MAGCSLSGGKLRLKTSGYGERDKVPEIMTTTEAVLVSVCFLVSRHQCALICEL